MEVNVVSSFYEAMRKGQVLDINGRTGSNIYTHRIAPMKLEAMPSFDFGHINNPPHPDAWSKELYDDLWEEWRGSKRINLPFPASIYIFRFRESATQYETINLMIVTETARGFSIETYFHQPKAPRGLSQWTHHPVTSVFDADRLTMDYGQSLARFDAGAQADFDEDARSNYTAVIAATLLMNRRRTVEAEETGGMAATNIGRAKGRLAPLPDTIRVKLGEIAVAPSTSHGGTHASPIPHDRRAHFRKRRKGVDLPRDQWIRVKASHPNGGSDKARQYQVSL